MIIFAINLHPEILAVKAVFESAFILFVFFNSQSRAKINQLAAQLKHQAVGGIAQNYFWLQAEILQNFTKDSRIPLPLIFNIRESFNAGDICRWLSIPVFMRFIKQRNL